MAPAPYEPLSRRLLSLLDKAKAYQLSRRTTPTLAGVLPRHLARQYDNFRVIIRIMAVRRGGHSSSASTSEHVMTRFITAQDLRFARNGSTAVHRGCVGRDGAQIQRDRLVSHLYQARREYRWRCETAGKSASRASESRRAWASRANFANGSICCG